MSTSRFRVLIFHIQIKRKRFALSYLRLFVILESLSHSLASSSVKELLSSWNTIKIKQNHYIVRYPCYLLEMLTVAVGSGVSSFLLLGVLLARVTRFRRCELGRRRRCGRLLFAPGVFFHK